MISTAIKRAFEKAKKRDWEQVYMAIDIHDTMIPGNYDKSTIPSDFYDGVIEAIRYIQHRTDIVTIVYSCSHPEELNKYHEMFVKLGIYFDHYNENPNVLTTEHGLGNYDKKLYFDILLEDKAGFEPLTDWKLVVDTLKEIPALCLE